MAFEENARELSQNVASLGFDLDRLVAAKQLAIDHVFIERSEIEETGSYDLEGLFIRLGSAIDSVGAKRVVLDTIEALFSGLPSPAILRAELRRLFRWLKARGVTALITGERGSAGLLTRYGMEEYVSDCVIILDHRVTDQGAIRKLRVAKYRGSAHGTNEYPFLLGDDGITLWPITSLQLTHGGLTERVSSGVAGLDAMLGGRGFFRGSTILVTGTAGTGKSSLAASFAHAACARGERCLYFAFEESAPQILRNMRSIGLDLAHWLKRGRLKIHAVRPSYCGLEMHLAQTVQAVAEFAPDVVVLDPVTSLEFTSDAFDLKTALMRIIDYLKLRGVTTLLTGLTHGGESLEWTRAEVSSLVDTWIVVRDIESEGERNRGLHVLKARGTAHSNRIREFLITDRGLQLVDVYVGPDGVLAGSARVRQEALDRVERLDREAEKRRRQLALRRKREAAHQQIAALEADLAADEGEFQRWLAQEQRAATRRAADRIALARDRHPIVAKGDPR